MVRTNQKTDFSFPFVNAKETVITPTYLDSTDRLLSSFAISFFMGVLFLIALDGANFSFHNNAVTSNWSQQSMIPNVAVFLSKNDADKTEKIKLPLEEKKITPKAAVIIEPTSENSKEISTNKNVVSKKELPAVVKTPVKTLTATTTPTYFSKKDISLKTEKSLKLNISPSKGSLTPILNSNPTLEKTKSVLSEKIAEEKVLDKLVLNEEITQNLLPLSYFEAKAKAEAEGKLLLIKFGAKWCLPCRQMNEVTFKDQRVVDILQKKYVPLNIDVDDFDGLNLQSYYNVKMLPTMLVFNSNGKFLAKYSKFISANKMTELLLSHSSKEMKPIMDAPQMPILKNAPAPRTPKVVFNQIHLKKTIRGNSITSFKGKAKNWRFTSINMDIHNIHDGIIKVNIIEKKSGKEISTIEIPHPINNSGSTDTTTTNFQLDLPLTKRKKKEGEYVLEIFHILQNSSKLIGETTLAKEGIISLAN